MKFINKYIMPLIIIFFGCVIINWAFSYIAINYIIPLINNFLIALTLDKSILYLFSEILIFGILGSISFVISAAIIAAMDKYSEELPLITIVIPMGYRLVFWVVHFSSISDYVLQIFNVAPLKALNMLISIITIDVVFFVLFLFERKNLLSKRMN